MANNNHLTTRNPVFYKNYDLYDVGQKNPPVGFYQEMDKYKSVADFLKKTRKNKKKNKNKKKSKRRKRAFLIATASDLNHIDFPLDEQTTPILGSNDSLEGANAIGFLDHFTLPNDFDDKNVGNLDYGQEKDYPEYYPLSELKEDKDIDLSPMEYNPYGLPDGILDRNETDPLYDTEHYGNTNSGNQAFTHISW